VLFKNKECYLIYFLLFLGSFNCGDKCYVNYYQNVTSYKVNPNAVTPSGIKVDTGGHAVDLVYLDERIKNIEDCLMDVMKVNSVITAEEQINWQCLKREFVFEPIKRDCFVIKIIDAVFSECSEWQFLPVFAPEQLCKDKGLEPNPKCLCKWRVAVQDDNVLVTPPALYLWDITRIVTGCNAVWNSKFVACMMF
jgi:hypothetical protein